MKKKKQKNKNILLRYVRAIIQFHPLYSFRRSGPAQLRSRDHGSSRYLAEITVIARSLRVHKILLGLSRSTFSLCRSLVTFSLHRFLPPRRYTEVSLREVLLRRHLTSVEEKWSRLRSVTRSVEAIVSVRVYASRWNRHREDYVNNDLSSCELFGIGVVNDVPELSDGRPRQRGVFYWFVHACAEYPWCTHAGCRGFVFDFSVTFLAFVTRHVTRKHPS